jgi:hypothetical protein
MLVTVFVATAVFTPVAARVAGGWWVVGPALTVFGLSCVTGWVARRSRAGARGWLAAFLLPLAALVGDLDLMTFVVSQVLAVLVFTRVCNIRTVRRSQML